MPPRSFNRKKKVEKPKFKFKSTERFLQEDPRFKNLVVSKFINQLMYDGKKSVARQITYEAIEGVAKKLKEVEPLEVFLQAINNVKPQVEVRSKRVGGATYQVPMEVNRKRQQALSIRQLILQARSKKGKPMAQRLSEELVDAFNRQGASVMWKDNVHKMAEANKLFAHFAW